MSENKPDVDELLEMAATLEEQGAPLDAMRTLNRALEVRRDPLVLTRIGALALDLEKLNEAEEALLSAIEVDPDFGHAYTYLGMVYRAQGRLEAALIFFRRAVSEVPSAITFTLLGVAQMELEMAEAEQSFRQAISINPSHLEAYYNWAVHLRDVKKQEAIALLEKAIDIDPKYARAHRELGWLLRRTEHFPEAEYHLRRAIELNNSDGWAYIYLGNLMWATGDAVSADTAFMKAVEVWPDRSIPYWSLAHFRERQGKEMEAESLYKKALEIDPGDAQANWRFGSYLRDIGDYRDAKHYLGNAVELDSDDKRARAALSELDIAMKTSDPEPDNLDN